MEEQVKAIRAAIWARVSTTDQHAQNQLAQLREWAANRGLRVVTEYVTEDSGWLKASGHGEAFDAARTAMEEAARLGTWDVLLVWAVDRLGRRGIEDTLGVLRRLYGRDVEVWSHQESWLVTSEPRMRELLVSFMAWLAEQESARRSERVKAGLERRRAEGKPVGRKPGSKDRKPRKRSAYYAAWEDGGARRARQEEARS